MTIIEAFFLGLALAMDSFAVALCFASSRPLTAKNSFSIAFTFGTFQALMPILGFYLSSFAFEYIKDFDHWIAFLILFFLGLKMIKNSLTSDETCPAVNRYSDPSNILILLSLGLATSIDALAVGVSIACLEDSIYLPAITIGVTTFALSLVACLMGAKIEKFFKGKAEFFGGIILIAIACKILLEGLEII